MLRQIGKAQRREPALSRAEHLTGASQSQILFGDAETVLGLAQDCEPLPRDVVEWCLIQQNASRRLVAAADAPAQLVQLRKAKAFRMFHNHDRRGGYIDAD